MQVPTRIMEFITRLSRDIVIDRIDGSSPPSVTVLELNKKKEAVGVLLQIP